MSQGPVTSSLIASQAITPPTPPSFFSPHTEEGFSNHFLWALGVETNIRNLECLWKPVCDSVAQGVIGRVKDAFRSSQRPLPCLAVLQEQPLVPASLNNLSQDADQSISAFGHPGTLFPDLSIIHYLSGLRGRRNVGRATSVNMTHSDYKCVLCAELKRCIRRMDLAEDIHSATCQVERQAILAVDRPGVRDHAIILFAMSGPFWMWTKATCAELRSMLNGTSPKALLRLTDEELKIE
ncbi:hypothetical protein CONPUDRAFT_78485 [Coniophora puteana RWD-64-598 SS2]|uniref:Uncharacterized protein n=1 Tax=Coniophora puteana (strain RWD-64-598) TaxID=741705 RepID=R7SD78_CONPW|nr:uncharacterized protein CONPUDRAFT_78485 [Coniophora puteana RWD-64-598 SS2]EIW73810.1 hypothetical protein CONPUDRAFT_78485 [Coniophora puteana RWD-64-598 SS2]